MKKITRQEAINQIIEAMNNWDQETLLQWAKDIRQDMLDTASNATLTLEFEEDCNELVEIIQ